MKIEKLSENQIRCTLNKSDLASRQLKISELAYGSEKAKELFRDMMQQASYEFGFEAEDIPLMIEAIPVSADCIVLIVTKVDDPEELDTRFSKFSPADADDEFNEYDYPYTDYDTLETMDSPINSALPSADEELTLAKEADSADTASDSVADDVLNLFSKVKDYLNKSIVEGTDIKDSSKPSVSSNKNEASAQPDPEKNVKENNITRIFSFDSLDSFTEAAVSVLPVYNDKNHLYKNTTTGRYYLFLEKNYCTSVNFNKACNILSEYGTKEYLPNASFNYYKEHMDCIIKSRAIQVMAKL